MKDLFSGLGDLGFKNIENMPIFHKPKGKKDVESTAQKQVTAMDCLFDKSYTCPVCGTIFKDKAVKTSKATFVRSDLDLMPTYTPLYPFFYSIVLCSGCGYASISENFYKVSEPQCRLIIDNISNNFKYKEYDMPLSIEDAIERSKFALLNAVVKRGKSGEKGYLCLVISWLYKLNKDKNNRRLFIKNTYDFLTEAYSNDTFPIYGMDEYAMSYLLGELARILGDYESASKWVSIVLGSRSAKPKAKEMALDLKERIKNAN